MWVSAQEPVQFALEPILLHLLLRKLPHGFRGEVLHGALPRGLDFLQAPLDVGRTLRSAAVAPLAVAPAPVVPAVPAVVPVSILGRRVLLCTAPAPRGRRPAPGHEAGALGLPLEDAPHEVGKV